MVDTIKLFTDGACRGNPGPGGWGVLMIHPEKVRELSGGALDTTNNRMELMAAIEGLRALTKTTEVELFTDSKYVMLGMTQWLEGWKRRGWRTASKKPVKNQDLWEQLDALCSKHSIDWHWVKGHAGHEGNERADALANLGLENTLNGSCL